MKALRLMAVISVMGVAACVATACTKEAQEPIREVVSKKRVVGETIQYCGDVKTVDFLAGQFIQAGSVIVGNDENNLYVTFSTTNGWEMKETHLYVGDGTDLTNAGGSPAPGQFPYKENHSPRVTTYTYTIPLIDLPPCMIIAAHAAVEKWVDGQLVDAQTAWGNGEKIGKSWAMKFEYCKQECRDVPPTDPCYQDETAWAAGTRYVSKGNWATYTPYIGQTEVKIFAGQHYEVGSVSFSSVINGKVTIAIELKNGWALNSSSESVKIQGYTQKPLPKNPAPGSFDSYKGTNLTVEVDAYNFYGIHLDVRKEIPCPK